MKQALGYGLDNSVNRLSPSGSSLVAANLRLAGLRYVSEFPGAKGFPRVLGKKSLEGPLFAVAVAHSKLIKPAELSVVDGVFPLLSLSISRFWQVRWLNRTMRKHRSRQRQNRPYRFPLHPVPAVAAFRRDRKRWRLRQQRCLEVASRPTMLA
jgi:uncharacterized protein Usg